MNLEIQQKKEKGITLIALVITIIVLLILAGVTIGTLTGDNSIIWKAKETDFKTDIVSFQEELRVAIYNDYIEKNGQRKEADRFTTTEYKEIQKIIPSFKEKYKNKIAIKEDELIYIGLDEKERKWMGETKNMTAPKLTVNYVDEFGNKLVESYITTVTENRYSIESPEIDGYKPLYDILEGEISEDLEVNVVYYTICNNLVFVGLDASGNETTNEKDIVAYKVSGIGMCNNSKIAIPEYYNEKPVTQIKEKAFALNTNIQGLVIPSTIQKIDTWAFQGCTNLESLNLNAKNSGRLVFQSCTNLQSVVIGKNVATISDIFYGCSNLKEVMIYSENLSIAGGLFTGCNELTEIKVNKDNNSYTEIDGVMYSKDGTKLLLCPPAKEEFIISSQVKEIGSYAFYSNKKIRNIDIPDTVEEVKIQAFQGCTNLKSLNLNAKNSGRLVFQSCTNLQSVVIGKNVATISDIFYGCSNLKEVMIYSENLSIAGGLFTGCNELTEIKVNKDNNSYTEIDGVMYSKDGTKLLLCPPAKEEFIISSQVKEIGSYAFYSNKKIRNIDIPDTVEEVKIQAFQDCTNLESINLNAKKLGRLVFLRCTNLQNVVIGKNVVTISDVFNNCSKLKTITYMGNMEEWKVMAQKNSVWNSQSSISSVVCIDGTIAI